jgi:hypothetical protein
MQSCTNDVIVSIIRHPSEKQTLDFGHSAFQEPSSPRIPILTRPALTFKLHFFSF